MARITFYGAAGTVTGSRHFFELKDKKYLIDCGLFQGKKANRLKNWEPFPVPPAEIDRVFLTHAHIDHTGFLPRVVKDGFQGPVHSTRATHDLNKIMLRDSAHLQEEDAKWANKKGFSKHKPALPLYTTEDAENALKLFQPKYYGEEFFIDDNIRVKFKDAGHILGSSFVEFRTRNNDRIRKILFSGDIGRPDRPVLRDPTQVFNVDYLVLESTYGDRLHGDIDPTPDLARIVNEQGAVEFHHVTIVRDEPDGVWVSGLPEVATLITVGQELVVPGELVEVDFEARVEMPASNRESATPPEDLSGKTTPEVASGSGLKLSASAL